jgi:hypothetical protein
LQLPLAQKPPKLIGPRILPPPLPVQTPTGTAQVPTKLTAIVRMSGQMGEGTFTSFFQGRFDYNGCGNILGSNWIWDRELFNNGNGNLCVNLQNAIKISQIGLYIGVLMMIGGIIALTVSLSRRNRRQENLSYRR